MDNVNRKTREGGPEKYHATEAETRIDLSSSDFSDQVDRLGTTSDRSVRLAALRARALYIPILPLPNSVVGGLLKATVAANLFLPQGTKAIIVKASAICYMSRDGLAAIPTANTDQTKLNDATSDSGNVPIIIGGPGDYATPFYVEDIKNLSFIAPADTQLSVMCFQQYF